ncbi:Replication initiation factor [compost metagenome]
MSVDEKLVLEGNRVKVLTQGRQVAAAAQSGVIVDYFRFTFKRVNVPHTRKVPGDTDDQNLARWFAHVFAQLLGFVVGVDRPGRDYYEFTTTIDNAFGHEVASVSAGGESQRGTICVTLKGEGCTMARAGWEQRVHAYFGEFAPTITRIDLAKDFFEGEVDISELVGLYQAHGFSYRNRRPKHQCHGSWLGIDDSGEIDITEVKLDCLDLRGLAARSMFKPGHSRTFQVGMRESGKLFRGYEKGHQYGLMSSKWLRGEVELRNVNRVIPWDAVMEPAQFFAGAYEATNWLCNHPVATRVPTATKVAEASAERCIAWVRRVVAPTLVQITKVMPNEDWLVGLVLEEQNRRVPRSLRGLDHQTMQHGITESLRKYTNPEVPALAVL